MNHELRIIFIINSELKMSQGKIISQCMHGYDGLIEKNEKNKLIEWRNTGSAKIVLKGTVNEMNEINKLLKLKEIKFYSVIDAGRTQIEPGSNTIIAIGPINKNEINEITGQLKLY